MSKIPIPEGLIEEPIDHAVDIISKTFATDGFQRYCCMEELRKSGAKDIPLELNKKIFKWVIPSQMEGGGRCLTVPNSGISSVWTLDKISDEYQPDPSYSPAITEINMLAHSIRQPHLPPTATHKLHLALLGNDRDHPSNDKSRNAKVSHVIRPVLAMARQQGWPVVLESTSPKSRDMYMHLGFENLSEITVGKGVIDGEGREKEGGEGLQLWVMMFK